MLLSIVMMIKNEQRHLDKTLKALIPLMKDIKSELIILDTGSTDSSVDIARKYTDKLYFANWNKNFADMRNTSISYAKGDWILILDADEELTNYKKLKEFFDKEKYKSYNTATIELKNIFSEDEKVYSTGSLPRLFKNIDGFKYEGAIHEQPKYKGPIYNNIATFKHYGYMFVNEELRQIKTKRNMEILSKELKKDPNSVYINYQMGQSYNVISKHEDALFYFEKAYKLSENLGDIPIFVVSELARLYIDMGKFNKCEKICENYIKNDDKNIDIYYYLAIVKNQLEKFKESLKYYERYKYLIDNYEISTQANNMRCIGDTISFRKKCELEIININYKIENYEEVVKKMLKLDIEMFNAGQYIIISSLYKLNKIEDIIDLYNTKTNTISEKVKFKDNLERLLLKTRESDKDKLYSIYSKLDGNYSYLNHIRMNEKINIEKCNDILKNETDVYYGDLIYYALKQGINIESILKDVSYVNIENYISYIAINRKDIVLDLYNCLIKLPNTLNLNKLIILLNLSKSLLNQGNLIGDKYKKIFLIYCKFNYTYIKSIYSNCLSDETLLNLIRDKEDRFIIEFKQATDNKSQDSIKYIKSIKELLLKNPHHKKGLEIIIKDFEKSLYENEEVKELKLKYIDLIKKSIQNGKLEEADKMISEYESIYGEEEILNIKAVCSIYKGNVTESEKLLKLAYINDINNLDILFNIAYVKETIGDIEEAKNFYLEILKTTDDINIKEEVNCKLETL